MLTHPSDPAIVVTVGIDGVLKVWDIEQPQLIKPLQSFTNKLEWGPAPTDANGQSDAPTVAPCLDAAIAPDGLSMVMSDRCGRWTLYGTEPKLNLISMEESLQSSAAAAPVTTSLTAPVPREQYFASDYHETQQDADFSVLDVRTQLPVHVAPRGSLITANGDPWPDALQPPVSGQLGPLPLSALQVAAVERQVATRVAALAELLAERANGFPNGQNSRYYNDGLQVANGVRLQQGRVTTRGGMSTLRAARSSGAAGASAGMYEYDYYGGSGNDEPYDDGGGDYAEDSDVMVSHHHMCINSVDASTLYCIVYFYYSAAVARYATASCYCCCSFSSATLIAQLI
jgi:hypothetical protein